MWISMKLDIPHVAILPILAVFGCTLGVAQKYQHVLGFMTEEILSCLLVLNRKLSWGTLLECHVSGVNKQRINTMFRTRTRNVTISDITMSYFLIQDFSQLTKLSVAGVSWISFTQFFLIWFAFVVSNPWMTPEIWMFFFL